MPVAIREIKNSQMPVGSFLFGKWVFDIFKVYIYNIKSINFDVIFNNLDKEINMGINKKEINPVFNDLNKSRNQKADCLHQSLRKHGVNFATGVPCGVLRHIINNLINDKSIIHVLSNRESEAVGIAAGAYLSGKCPVVYMQNSGLFAASNDIASLLIPYKIPILFVVTYRGCEGEDAVQHLITGKATEKLLKSFDIDFFVYQKQDIDDLIDEIFGRMKETSLPSFLLLKRGWNK